MLGDVIMNVGWQRWFVLKEKGSDSAREYCSSTGEEWLSTTVLIVVLGNLKCICKLMVCRNRHFDWW